MESEIFGSNKQIYFDSKEQNMPIPENVRKNWIEIQKKFNHPVNAIGVKIAETDAKTLSVWKEEGIDQYQQK